MSVPVGHYIEDAGRDDPGYTTRPKAFINYIFLDEQFRYAGGSFSPVSSGAGMKSHFSELQDIAVPKNGYVYIYVSNESPVDVFFDNLQVVHTRGPILEETHYYPFGLTMAGISSKALNGVEENKKKYNGIEKETDFQLDIYDAQFRELDGQIGRWWEIDPATENMEMWSPYVSNYDNPIRYQDPLGDEPEEGEGCCGGLWKAIVQTGKDIITFGSSAANAFATNQVGGVGRGDPNSYDNSHDAMVSQMGQTFGDFLTIGGSVATSIFSVPVVAGTGGTGAAVVTLLLVQQWTVATPTAIQNIVNDYSGNRVNSTSNSSGGGKNTSSQTQEKKSKVEKSTKIEQIGGGKYSKKVEVRPGKGPGQSRAEYIRYRNKDGKVIKSVKDSYDRANKFQYRKNKPLPKPKKDENK